MRLHPIVIAIFSLTILVHAVNHAIWVAGRFGSAELSLSGFSLHLGALVPAVGYFWGLRWCRYVVGSVAALLVPLLLLMPLALHEVERTPWFYAYWGLALVVFAVTAATSFYRDTPPSAVV